MNQQNYSYAGVTQCFLQVYPMLASVKFILMPAVSLSYHGPSELGDFHHNLSAKENILRVNFEGIFNEAFKKKFPELKYCIGLNVGLNKWTIQLS